jgi:hypothetical protein
VKGEIMELTKENVTRETVATYYQTVSNFNIYLVLELISDDPAALAAYEAWLAARTAASTERSRTL